MRWGVVRISIGPRASRLAFHAWQEPRGPKVFLTESLLQPRNRSPKLIRVKRLQIIYRFADADEMHR